MNSVFQMIIEEARIRFLWIFICFVFTLLTCYSFSEEFVFLLAKPFLVLRIEKPSFICTQMTEALKTYMQISLSFALFFCFPFFSYQIWCFVIPSCYKTQRVQWTKLLYLSVICFLLVFFLIYYWVVPIIWNFLFTLNTTSTNLLHIQLQPKIYDYILLTVRILFVSSICSQVPVFMIFLIESKRISVKTCIKNRRSFLFFSVLIAAFFTPPDIWFQFFCVLPIYGVIELAIFYAFLWQIYQVRQNETTENQIK
jgi:Tat protein translocase TatC